MFFPRRQPALTFAIALSMVVVGVLPGALLAQCCCDQVSPTQPATCCCQAVNEAATASCCTVALDHSATGCECEVCHCAQPPASPPVAPPRSDDQPRVDFSLLALPAVLASVPPQPQAINSAPSILVDDLPPPVRERFCVWVI